MAEQNTFREPILNISRGKNVWREIVFVVDASFDHKSMLKLQDRMRTFLQSDPTEFKDSGGVRVQARQHCFYCAISALPADRC